MDFKQQAAREAVTLIQNGMTIGLGAGATMAYMAHYLQEENKAVQIYSSSADTRTLLKQHGFEVKDISGNAFLDLYFDGCDQFDNNLNALKSGGGIHTMEKLLASMAKEFILVGDISKYSEALTTKFPVVLEVLPQAQLFVSTKLEKLYADIRMEYRKNTSDNLTLTGNGNLLLNIWFKTLPVLKELNDQLKSITGVVETSLFYNLATKAITAGNEGIKIFTKQ